MSKNIEASDYIEYLHSVTDTETTLQQSILGNGVTRNDTMSNGTYICNRDSLYHDPI